jgi:hypothetical protein
VASNVGSKTGAGERRLRKNDPATIRTMLENYPVLLSAGEMKDAESARKHQICG